jgi:hypothetical protein
MKSPYIVEEDLRKMCNQLQLKVDKLGEGNKVPCSDAKKRNDKERQNKSKTRVRVLNAFEWEETTADPVLLRAVTEFWYALSQRTTEDNDGEAKQRLH